MTALDKYTRLESVGQWKEDPNAREKEVIVSFGDATLVLSDFQENPLSHWALAGLHSRVADGGAVTYSPDPAFQESLEIQDTEMIEAIALVSKLISEPEKAPKKGVGLIVALAVLVVGLVVLAPLAIRYQAQSMTGPETRRFIAYQMLDHPGLTPCNALEPANIKVRFLAQAFPEDPAPELVIVHEDVGGVLFPGEVILLGNADFLQFLSADDLGAWIRSSADIKDEVLNAYFRRAPLTTLLKYITSGALPEDDIRSFTARSVVEYELDIPAPSGVVNDPPVLLPQEWETLRQICLN